MPCGCTDKLNTNKATYQSTDQLYQSTGQPNNKALGLESMKDMSIDEILNLYRQGYILEENYERNNESHSYLHSSSYLPSSSLPSSPKMNISSLATCPTIIIQGIQKTITIAFPGIVGGVAPYTYHFYRDNLWTEIYTSSPITASSHQFQYTFSQANGNTTGSHRYYTNVTDSCASPQTSGYDWCDVTIQAPITVGNVTFHTNPVGAHIWIGGADNGPTTGSPTDGTLTLYNLVIGVLIYDVILSGYNPSTGNQITVQPGTTVNTGIIQLTPIPPATGSVEFHTNPGQAEVWQGNTLLCTTNSSGVCIVSSLPVGSLTFVVKMTGYIDSAPTNVTVIENVITPAPLVTLLPKTGSVRFSTTPGGADIWSGTDMLGTTSTGTTGTIVISNMAIGTWFFVAKKTGYTDSTQQSVIVEENVITNAPSVTLTPIINTGTVIFHVTCTGTPCIDAHITIGGVDKGTTLSDGTLTVPNLPTGLTNFNVTKDGYTPNSGTVTVTTGTTNASTVNLTIIPTGDVIFHVTCSGTPCADAHITIGGIDKGVTISDGTLTVPNLPTGLTNFNVTKDGYTPNSGTVTVTTGTTNASVVNLVPIVTGTGAVIFRVACTGAPCAGAHIKIGEIDKGATLADGTLIVSVLTPGSINFTVTKTGYINGSGSVTVIVDTTVNAPIINIIQAPQAGGAGGAAILAIVALGAAAVIMMKKKV